MIKEYEKQGLTSSQYSLIHKWVNERIDKTTPCAHCKESGKKMENALKKGKRCEKNLKNYIRLCISCHKKYDMNPERKKLLGSLAKGRTLSEETKEKIRQAAIANIKRKAA